MEVASRILQALASDEHLRYAMFLRFRILFKAGVIPGVLDLRYHPRGVMVRRHGFTKWEHYPNMQKMREALSLFCQDKGVRSDRICTPFMPYPGKTQLWHTLDATGIGGQVNFQAGMWKGLSCGVHYTGDTRDEVMARVVTLLRANNRIYPWI